MADVLVPRPAATVLVVRETTRLEVLMLRRNLNSDFVGGAYVFPGGRVDDDDQDLAEWVLGVSEADAADRLGLAGGALAYYAAGLRETFEESGLLLVCTPEGAPVDLAGSHAQLARERAAQNEGRATLRDLLAENGWRLDARHMEYFAHWVTPVGPPRRYDTRFFVVGAPAGQHAVHDEGETVDTQWVAPAEALAAQSRGEFEMIFPTIRTLEEVAGFTTLEDLLAHARSRQPRRREPRIVERDGEIEIELIEDTP